MRLCCACYGFTDRLDGELAVALYDGAALFGGNIEAALLRALQLVGSLPARMDRV
ncbi:MAG TPA: hypothetical protein VGR27_14330 [Longimicrobiaceae bacterium]|nr:hypothetical protein [Longimicrobiaceae bacterium]